MVKMKIVVPTYNTENWIERCLYSIYCQKFKNWECVVINDASTDNTAKVIDNLDFLSSDSRFTVIHNDKNVKALKNIVDGFNILSCEQDPDCVMMVIDGDDFLFSDSSLSVIEAAYQQNPQLLLTYGDWIGHPYGDRSNCRPYSADVIRNSDYRNSDFWASHLRTFKSRLWYSISDEDLKDQEGNYFTAGWDVAFMIPMLEMAQERHMYLPYVLYCYNKENPISDFRVHAMKQESAVVVTKNRQKYERLEVTKC
jgi:glycosyltransferase involved in cell wall biosynthesis